MDRAISQPRKISRLRWYHLMLPALAVAVPVGLWWMAMSRVPPAVKIEGGRWVLDTGEYAGHESCRQCHKALVDQQLASSHAQTIRRLDKERPRAPLSGQSFVVDPLNGARYSVIDESGRAAINVAVGSLSQSQKLDYEFGSGVHAYGYMSKTDDGVWVDARLNYYVKIKAWDFTSSQDKPERHLITQPLGRPQKPGTAARCFTCHSTVVRADGIDKSSADGSGLTVRPERSVLNVTCEGCHGPMASHAREKKAKAPVERSGPMGANQMNRMCGKCHGLEDIDPKHPLITRFQPWGLAKSRCFTQSDGKLSCATCHDPHDNARHDVKFYEAICMSCHTPKPETHPKPVVCPVDSKQGCVGCHMPKDDKSMRHVAFLDHQIRVVRDPGVSRR
jgi:hypothetical protein